MTNSDRRRASAGFVLAGCAALLFASKGLFSKALNAGGVDYLQLTTMRALLSLPLFAGLALWRGLALNRAPRAAVLRAALAGVLCYGIGALVDFHALELVDISLERALLFSYPALVIAWHAVVDRRLPSPTMLTALLLTYAGIVLVVGAFDPELWQRNLKGALLVMGSAATTACYFLLGERCVKELGSGGFTIIAMTAAAAFLALAFLFVRPVGALVPHSTQAWLLLAGMALFCMFLPTLCQAEAIRRLGAARGALASTIGPPAAMLLGVLLLGERPTPWQFGGTALIVAGIVTIARRGGTA